MKFYFIVRHLVLPPVFLCQKVRSLQIFTTHYVSYSAPVCSRSHFKNKSAPNLWFMGINIMVNKNGRMSCRLHCSHQPPRGNEHSAWHLWYHIHQKNRPLSYITCSSVALPIHLPISPLDANVLGQIFNK